MINLDLWQDLPSSEFKEIWTEVSSSPNFNKAISSSFLSIFDSEGSFTFQNMDHSKQHQFVASGGTDIQKYLYYLFDNIKKFPKGVGKLILFISDAQDTISAEVDLQRIFNDLLENYNTRGLFLLIGSPSETSKKIEFIFEAFMTKTELSASDTKEIIKFIVSIIDSPSRANSMFMVQNKVRSIIGNDQELEKFSKTQEEAIIIVEKKITTLEEENKSIKETLVTVENVNFGYDAKTETEKALNEIEKSPPEFISTVVQKKVNELEGKRVEFQAALKKIENFGNNCTDEEASKYLDSLVKINELVSVYKKDLDAFKNEFFKKKGINLEGHGSLLAQLFPNLKKNMLDKANQYANEKSESSGGARGVKEWFQSFLGSAAKAGKAFLSKIVAFDISLIGQRLLKFIRSQSVNRELKERLKKEKLSIDEKIQCIDKTLAEIRDCFGDQIP